MKRNYLLLAALIVSYTGYVHSQEKYIELNLQQTVELANDSSLAAFRAKKQLYGELLGIQNIQSEPVAVALPLYDAHTV
jgi:hypothetical protein